MFKVFLERQYLRRRVKELEDQLLVLAASRDELEASLRDELDAIGRRYRAAKKDCEQTERELGEREDDHLCLKSAVWQLLELKGRKGSAEVRKRLAELVGFE